MEIYLEIVYMTEISHASLNWYNIIYGGFEVDAAAKLSLRCCSLALSLSRQGEGALLNVEPLSTV